MACPRCASGFHEHCKSKPCCCSQETNVEEVEENEDEDEDERRQRRRGTWSKRDETLRDQQSTGRKRAAVLYPLDRDASCEWKGLRFAGGGKHPIIGCVDGKQQARHHGPNKNTLANEQGNVHRICHTCHNRWHAENDEDYNWDGPWDAHNVAIKATLEEIADNEFDWHSRGKLKKAVD